MGHGADDVHVVGDEQVGQALVALQALQQHQHLLLDGDVERAGGFVEHQHLGLHDERTGNGQALALAAREGMGVTCQQAGELGLRKAHLGQRGQHLVAPLGGAQAGLVHLEAFAHDFFDGEARREG